MKKPEIDPAHFTKSYEMVGEYMNNWSSMESRLDNAIGAALNLSLLQRIVVCSNIAFNAKCNILLTLVSATYFEGVKQYEKAIKKALAISADRNMIAHHEFFPIKGDEFAVRFYAYKAKGKLGLPSENWSEEDFKKKIAEIESLRKKFEALEALLSPKDIESALNKFKSFTPGRGLLG